MLCNGGLASNLSFGCLLVRSLDGWSMSSLFLRPQEVYLSQVMTDCEGSVSTMVFGLCATRVITFVIGIGKDIAVGRKQNLDKVGTTKDPGFSGPRFEDVTEEKKKE